MKLFVCSLSALLAFSLDGIPEKAAAAATSQDRSAPPHALVAAPCFTDHMVLQRDLPGAIWGRASPDAEVCVTFAGQRKTALADRMGRWKVTLDPLAVQRQPQGLRITSPSESLEFADILVGDVWICAGQSNMEFPLVREQHAAEELPKSNRPLVRLLNMTYAGQNVFAKPFTIETAARLTPERFYRGNWQLCGPKTAAEFSAVAYYFGKDVQEKLGVPIGLINVAVGGSPTEAWVRREVLAADPQLKTMLDGNWLRNPSLGDWCRQRAGENLDRLLTTSTSVVPGDKLGPNHAYKPGFLWDSGVARLMPLAIRGVIWYQGESNSLELPRVVQHERLFPLLVRDWREQWKQGAFPFYFCQLPGIELQTYHSQYWPEFRESQRRMAAALPNVGMAVTSDLGDRHDVHPRNKREVGQRLALLALARTYHLPVECDGPEVACVNQVDQSLHVRFDHAENGLATSDSKPLRGFEIAARQGEYYPAEAAVNGSSVVVANRLVPNPARVRYAWQPFPDANLINAAGLPASTFTIELLPERKQP